MSKKMSNFAPDFERQKSCPGGGMVDAVDSKSAVSNGVRVQVPPGVQEGGLMATFLFSIYYFTQQSVSLSVAQTTFKQIWASIEH